LREDLAVRLRDLSGLYGRAEKTEKLEKTAEA
jgi:hypothetical protein